MFLLNSWAKHRVCHSNDIVPLFLPSWCRIPWYRIIFESGAVFVSTTRTWFSVHPLTIENPPLSPSQFSCNLASYIFVRDRLENGIREMEYGRIKATLHLSISITHLRTFWTGNCYWPPRIRRLTNVRMKRNVAWGREMKALLGIDIMVEKLFLLNTRSREAQTKDI